VTLSNNIIIAQHVVMSGLNHGYEDIDTPIRYQPTITKPIVLEDDCWIGANVTITAGVTVGKHAVVAGGSVVTRSVAPFTVVGGNPARVLRHYDTATQRWLAGPADTITTAR
jgi:acetyltransferase-like isoleucine patch superfamily enzyme